MQFFKTLCVSRYYRPKLRKYLSSAYLWSANPLDVSVDLFDLQKGSCNYIGRSCYMLMQFSPKQSCCICKELLQVQLFQNFDSSTGREHQISCRIVYLFNALPVYQGENVKLAIMFSMEDLLCVMFLCVYEYYHVVKIFFSVPGHVDICSLFGC